MNEDDFFMDIYVRYMLRENLSSMASNARALFFISMEDQASVDIKEVDRMICDEEIARIYCDLGDSGG